MAGFYRRPYDTVYKPGQSKTFKVSRSKIDFFLECPRCFWLDRRKQIRRPDTPPFNINLAIDGLLKREFDTYRTQKVPHPWMVESNIKAVPFQHDELAKWRENFIGVQYLHPQTNLTIFGAVDDVWQTDTGELIVVDYKATAKKTEVNINAEWQIAYKRQLEVYQWLLRRNGFTVSSTGYFVYANGRLDGEGFFNKLDFVTKIIAYTGDDNWVEPTIIKLKETLEQAAVPLPGSYCEYCVYARSRAELTVQALIERQKERQKKNLRPATKTPSPPA